MAGEMPSPLTQGRTVCSMAERRNQVDNLLRPYRGNETLLSETPAASREVLRLEQHVQRLMGPRGQTRSRTRRIRRDRVKGRDYRGRAQNVNQKPFQSGGVATAFLDRPDDDHAGPDCRVAIARIAAREE